MQLWRSLLLGIVFSLSASHSWCLETLSTEVSGFGDLTLMTTSSEVLGFRNDVSVNEGTFKDDWRYESLSRVGLQVDTYLTHQWDFVAQWLVQEQDKESLDGYTRMAFARYVPNENWALRLGRLPINLFELSEFRDIGIAYSWTRVPTEIYGFVPFRSQDGFDVTFTDELDDTTFRITASYGDTETDVTSGNDKPIRITDLVSAGINVQGLNYSLSLRHSQAVFENDNLSSNFVIDALNSLQNVWPDARQLANDISLADKQGFYTSLYGAYRLDEFTLSAELSVIDSETILVEDFLNGYFDANYRFGKQSVYWTTSFAKSDKIEPSELVPDQPQFDPLERFVGEVVVFFRANQLSHSLGWRYDYSEQLAGKVQIQHSTVEGRGNGLWSTRGNLRTSIGRESITSLAIGISFSF